jgi:hypothetical protein
MLGSVNWEEKTRRSTLQRSSKQKGWRRLPVNSTSGVPLEDRRLCLRFGVCELCFGLWVCLGFFPHFLPIGEGVAPRRVGDPRTLEGNSITWRREQTVISVPFTLVVDRELVIVYVHLHPIEPVPPTDRCTPTVQNDPVPVRGILIVVADRRTACLEYVWDRDRDPISRSHSGTTTTIRNESSPTTSPDRNPAIRPYVD